MKKRPKKRPKPQGYVPLPPVALGRVIATPGVVRMVPEPEMLGALARHRSGVSTGSWEQNDYATQVSLQLLSSYCWARWPRPNERPAVTSSWTYWINGTTT